LAVGDIIEVQENATLERLGMQVIRLQVIRLGMQY